MNVHVSYKLGKTPDLEQEINQQVEQVRRRLQAAAGQQIEAALPGSERQNSEAFLLCAVEGLPPEEIAAIGDRTPDPVRHSILAAREPLRKSTPMRSEWKDKLLQHTKIA